MKQSKELFITMEPGAYHEFEKAQVEQHIQMAAMAGKIPSIPKPPVEDYSEEKILAFNRIFNKYDPLYTDPEFARQHGHPSCPAMPGMFNYTESVPGYGFGIGDLWYAANDGAEITMYQNIYPGMKISIENQSCQQIDETIPGDVMRVMKNLNENDGVDQDGNLIYHAKGNTRDAWAKYKPEVPQSEHQDFTANFYEWQEYFDEQVYNSDEDYEKMYEIWDKEVIAGDNGPCWEDVEIGTLLPETASDGPITYMHLSAWDAMGPEVMFGREMLRNLPMLKAACPRDRFGSFMFPTAHHYGGVNNPNGRMIFYNNTAPKIAYRTVTNWMGYKGRVVSYKWTLYQPVREMRIPDLCKEYFEKIPGYEGRCLERHPSEGDIIVGKGIVTDKYIADNGEHIVKIFMWIENIHGFILQGCPMEVALPGKEND